MNFLILALTLCFSFSIFACEEIPQEFKPFTSKSYSMLCRADYELAYSVRIKSALWSAEFLKKNEIGAAVRINAFKADPDLLPKDRAKLSDYNKSHYDRGHLTPARDASSAIAMEQSFYLSNMVPQVPNNNRGIWKSLEDKVANQVALRGELIIFTGPVYSASSSSIGKSKLPVPDKLFKIIFDRSTKEVMTFIIPNVEQDTEKLPTFISSLEELEKETGIIFFNNIPVKQSTNLWEGF